MRIGLPMVVIAALTAPAAAELKKHAGAQVEIDLPSSYTSKVESGGMLIARSADDSVGLLFWVVEKSNAEEAIKLLDAQLEGKVTDATWGKLAKANYHGLRGLRNVGTAKIAGKAAYTMVAVLGPTPTKKGLIVFGAIEQSKLAEHKAELAGIFASLKPSR